MIPHAINNTNKLWKEAPSLIMKFSQILFKKDQTLAEIISCIPYCATPWNQLPRQTITTYFLLTITLHYSEYQTWT